MEIRIETTEDAANDLKGVIRLCPEHNNNRTSFFLALTKQLKRQSAMVSHFSVDDVYILGPEQKLVIDAMRGNR